VIHPIKTPHADLEHYSYLIEWHGLRLFFSGDTDDPSAVLAAKGLDAAFLTPWLLRTLQQRGASLDARLVVSQHHNAGDPVPNFQSRLVLKQGDTLRIGPRNAAE
jgi:L-ascorbate metabolism protein UlaG (beta-lactamase superfamily)